MFRVVAATVTIAGLITSAEAQGLTPYYGPDGRVYYRRAPDAATYAPQPAAPQQPYAMPQTVPAPTTAPPAPRERKVKVKPKPKPKPKPDASKPPVEAAPAAVPETKPDPSPSPQRERIEIKHTRLPNGAVRRPIRKPPCAETSDHRGCSDDAVHKGRVRSVCCERS